MAESFLYRLIERPIAVFAAALSRPAGFATFQIVQAALVGIVFFLGSDTVVFAITLALSVAANTVTNAVLVAMDRDNCAARPKLDELPLRCGRPKRPHQALSQTEVNGPNGILDASGAEG
jgi:low affinity Fe/Cu permease